MSLILNAPEKSSKVINPRAMETGVMYPKRYVWMIIKTTEHSRICSGKDLAPYGAPPGIQGSVGAPGSIPKQDSSFTGLKVWR